MRPVLLGDNICATVMRLPHPGAAPNIAEDSQTLSPLLAGRAPPYEEALRWIQFDYTGDQTGDYMATASTVLVRSVVSERRSSLLPNSDAPLAEITQRLQSSTYIYDPPPPGLITLLINQLVWRLSTGTVT